MHKTILSKNTFDDTTWKWENYKWSPVWAYSIGDTVRIKSLDRTSQFRAVSEAICPSSCLTEPRINQIGTIKSRFYYRGFMLYRVCLNGFETLLNSVVVSESDLYLLRF